MRMKDPPTVIFQINPHKRVISGQMEEFHLHRIKETLQPYPPKVRKEILNGLLLILKDHS